MRKYVLDRLVTRSPNGPGLPMLPRRHRSVPCLPSLFPPAAVAWGCLAWGAVAWQGAVAVRAQGAFETLPTPSPAGSLPAPAAPAAVVQREYTALFGERDVTEDEVTLDEYYQALRAAELGEDLQLSRREASDITIVPDTADLAAYVEELRRHLRKAPAVAAPEAASGAPSPPTRTP